MSEMMPTFGGRTAEEISGESSEGAYTKYYPNRVVDKDKAEEMAYASKAYEELVVSAANGAIEHAKKVARGEEFYSKGVRDLAIREAQQAREDADLAAQEAADRYEIMQNEAQTVVAQAEALKKGGSVPELRGRIKEDLSNGIRL